jgi:hypothetical protein
MDFVAMAAELHEKESCHRSGVAELQLAAKGRRCCGGGGHSRQG